MLISIPVFVAALVVISKKKSSIEKVQVLHQIGKKKGKQKKLFSSDSESKCRSR